MKVPLTVGDFLDRAALVYGDRIGVVDEPDQPAASLGEITYRRMNELARAQAAALDELGIGEGARIAIVSHNAARLLIGLFGVSAFGRILVPVNFRLNAEEVAYIVEHSGAEVLLVDPELAEVLADVTAKHRFVLGAESDEVLYRSLQLKVDEYERLKALLRQTERSSAEALVEAVFADVDAFADTAVQTDDITCVAVVLA